MIELGIESTLVEAIKSGDKTIEIQLGKPRFLRIQEDDILSICEDFYYEDTVLESLSHALEVKVTQILYFETLKELFETVSYELSLPSTHSIDEAIQKYRKFYSVQDEQEYGVIAFTIEPVQ